MGNDLLRVEKFERGLAKTARPTKRQKLTITVAVAIGALLAAIPWPSEGGDRKENWQSLEADNGAIFKVDLNSISHFKTGAATVTVYAVEGPSFDPRNLHQLWFDCRGHFQDITGPQIGPTEYAPPRSIVGRMGGIACIGAKDTRLDETARPQPKDTPDHYCVGVSPEACARITAAEEGKSKPSFCKPGFAVAGSGLSPEQLRICYLLANEESRLNSLAANRSVNEKSVSHVYDLKVSATPSTFPTIVGSTNLPDGARLIVSINKPRLPNARERLAAGLPMCEDDCIPASGPHGETLGVTTVVESGTFSAGPFSWAGKPFWQGAFDVEIYLFLLPGEEIREKQLDRMKQPILTTSVQIVPQP
jgi:hypothetical protein